MTINTADFFVKMVVVKTRDQDSKKVNLRLTLPLKIFSAIENKNKEKCKQL